MYVKRYRHKMYTVYVNKLVMKGNERDGGGKRRKENERYDRV